jgi:hypothetical protein
MTKLTLLVKASNPSQISVIEDFLGAAFEGLDVTLQVLGSTVNRWLQVELSGEDEAVAKNYIAKEIGICPVNLKNINERSELKGYIINASKKSDSLTIDFGVIEPKPSYATIPLSSLQTALFEGKNIALQKIIELYGLADNLPVKIDLKDGELAENMLPAVLSTSQVDNLRNWRFSLLDRLIILGSPLSWVEGTLERARLDRDVLSVESLGLFEHVLTCKLGTDATGVIPRVGRYFRKAELVVFNPKRLFQFMGG